MDEVEFEWQGKTYVTQPVKDEERDCEGCAFDATPFAREPDNPEARLRHQGCTQSDKIRKCIHTPAIRWVEKSAEFPELNEAAERAFDVVAKTAEAWKDTGVRGFATGATRSADTNRYDPEGFMSPIVVERFCEYMNKHRVQPDGSLRAGDNWQKGIPVEAYMKGMSRHFLHLWTRYRGFKVMDPGAAADMEEDLCALRFNIDGMLFELLKDKRRATPVQDSEAVK